MNLIGINGAARTGKDTLANIMVKYYGFTKVAFADPLKKVISEAFTIPLQELYDDVKDNEYEHTLPLLKRHIESLEEAIQEYLELDMCVLSLFAEHEGKQFTSHREIMQYVGTEIFRAIDPDIWLKIFKKQADKYERVACPDARMPNERKLIKELEGTLVLVKRPGFEPKDHASEASFGKDEEYDMVITNSSLESGLQYDFRLWYEFIHNK